MRPESHRDQTSERRCGNCKFAAVPVYKDHLLCFHGDNAVMEPSSCSSFKKDVWINGELVGLLDGDEYDKIWGGGVVEDTDVCDEWQPEATT